MYEWYVNMSHSIGGNGPEDVLWVAPGAKIR
jgi:hypothetical protein